MIKLDSINVQYSINSGWKTYAPTNTHCSLEIHSDYILIDNNKNWFYDFVKRIQPSRSLTNPFPILILCEESDNIEHRNSARTTILFNRENSTSIGFAKTLTIKHLEYEGEKGLNMDISFLNLQGSDLKTIKDWFSSVK